ICGFTTLKMVAVAAMARPMVSTTAAVKRGVLRMSRKEYATSWVIDIETSMRRTAGRESSKAIGACNGYEDNRDRLAALGRERLGGGPGVLGRARGPPHRPVCGEGP